MNRNTMIQKASALLLALVMLFSLSATALAATDAGNTLDRAWTQNQTFTLADPAPWNLSELGQVVDVTDPRSVAAYWVWAVMRLTDNYDDGMEMMKYLFADIEPFGSGYTEGGMSGKAGWDSYFDERLDDPEYEWLPRAYFEGGGKGNGFVPTRPLTIQLHYNGPNTETINDQTLEQMGRLNIVYWVQSRAGGNQVNITLSKFSGSTRWYVTSGTSSTALFYDQRSALTAKELNEAKVSAGDTSTVDEHRARYGGWEDDEPTVDPNHKHDFIQMRNDASHWLECTLCGEAKDAAEHYYGTDERCITCGREQHPNPFTDVDRSDYYYHPVIWAYESGVTTGTSATTFGPEGTCTRGQVVTFLWRAAGKPQPSRQDNPFQDVKQSDWYYTAVLWAMEQGITAGTSATTFSPDAPCSSAQVITFLYRACGIGRDGWYEEARYWAVQAYLLGETGLTIAPDEDCPRSAIVTFLYRFYGWR